MTSVGLGSPQSCGVVGSNVITEELGCGAWFVELGDKVRCHWVGVSVGYEWMVELSNGVGDAAEPSGDEMESAQRTRELTRETTDRMGDATCPSGRKTCKNWAEEWQVDAPLPASGTLTRYATGEHLIFEKRMARAPRGIGPREGGEKCRNLFPIWILFFASG